MPNWKLGCRRPSLLTARDNALISPTIARHDGIAHTVPTTRDGCNNFELLRTYEYCYARYDPSAGDVYDGGTFSGRSRNGPPIQVVGEPMQKIMTVIAVVSLGGLLTDSAAAQESGEMSFFITSVGPGDGANLGGLAGADRHCGKLAKAAGSDKGTWRAYLSVTATDSSPAINARDRIGRGPWYNAKHVMVAKDVDDLHSDANNLGKQTSLTEHGNEVNGRGDQPNMHDILTGSQLDGTAADGDADSTCTNWASNGEGSASVGHHDRTGGGANPTSWNSAHGSRGCSQANLVATGGNGLFYCFAAD